MPFALGRRQAAVKCQVPRKFVGAGERTRLTQRLEPERVGDASINGGRIQLRGILRDTDNGAALHELTCRDVERELSRRPLDPRRARQVTVIQRNRIERSVQPSLATPVIGTKALIAVTDVLRPCPEQVHVGALVEGES
jgi:hypothetical protein